MPQNFPTNRQNPNRKDESIRRANRVIQTRTFVLMLIMGIGMFFLLFFKLYNLQITRHEELQAKAVSQQTRSSVVTASRGAIYDASGNILAISSTAETIFLSPKEINDALNDEENPVAWTKEVLAAALAKILDVSEEGILKKMARTDSMYEVLKFRVEEDIADQVRQYINDNKVKGVYLTTDAKRYYPYGDLAAQVIGFVGVDYTGLFGLEAEYDKELQGRSGLVVTAKANQQNDLLYEYSQYFDPENGDELQVTLEATVQYYLEKGMKDMCDAYSPANGATGIVLDVRNGGILAMASFPNYDLNDYATVTDKTLLEQMERGELDEEGAQQKQWRNKALNDTYEPGSTFKILTLSAALEEGLIDKTTSGEHLRPHHPLLQQGGPRPAESGADRGELLQPRLYLLRPEAGHGEVLSVHALLRHHVRHRRGSGRRGHRRVRRRRQLYPAGSGLLRLRSELHRHSAGTDRGAGRLRQRRISLYPPFRPADHRQRRQRDLAA